MLSETVRYIQPGPASLWTASSSAPTPSETVRTGAALLLASGGPGCCDYLAPVAAMVDDLVTVVRFEQRGCGRSSPQDTYTLAECVADLEAIRRAYGFERWAVGGHSWGADLALVYALTHPQRMTAIVGISGGRMNNDRSWSEAYREGRDGRGEAQPEYLYQPNLDVNRQLNADMKLYIQRPGLFRDLARLSMPALFVCGSDDIRPSWPTEQVAALMPNASFARIEGAEHVIWNTHAEELRAELRAFVGSIGD